MTLSQLITYRNLPKPSGAPARTQHSLIGAPAPVQPSLTGASAPTQHPLIGAPAPAQHSLTGAPAPTHHSLIGAPAARRLLVPFCAPFATLLLFGTAGAVRAGNLATIEDKGSHYAVNLDFQSGATHREIGEAYGRAIRESVPQFERYWDSYVQEYGGNWFVYRILLHRVRQLRTQLPQEYRDEIEGIASQLSGGTHNEPGDGCVSVDELYLLNLIGDACRMNQCCAVSVFGQRSATGQTICGRNLDWPDGKKNQLAQIQAVITYRMGDRSLVSISCLGFQGIVSGFNQSGVFAGVLDSGTGTRYSTSGRRSYVFDLRQALEQSTSLEQVGQALTTSGPYAFNHIVMLADRKHSAVLENNFSGAGTARRRELRYWNSASHPNFTWDISEAVGAVNCFTLKGNTDNHIDPLDWSAVKQGKPNSDINTPRWVSMKSELKKSGSVVTVDGIKSVISFYHPETRGNIYRGDLYNTFTFQSMVFEPNSMALSVAFRPRTGGMPARPRFETVSFDFADTLCRSFPTTPAPAPSAVSNSMTSQQSLYGSATGVLTLQGSQMLRLYPLSGVNPTTTAPGAPNSSMTSIWSAPQTSQLQPLSKGNQQVLPNPVKHPSYASAGVSRADSHGSTHSRKTRHRDHDEDHEEDDDDDKDSDKRDDDDD